jgi:hypothetical protein
VNRYLARGLLSLYPRAWRARYGAEVINLAGELISAGETTSLLAALNLIGGAALERGRVLAGSRRAALAMAVAAMVAVAGSFYAAAHARPQATPASLASASCVFLPGSAGAAAIPGRIQACLKTGAKPGQFSQAVVPVRILPPGKPRTATAQARAAAGPCVIPPALCRPGAAEPGRVPAPAAVRPARCPVASPPLCRLVSGSAQAGATGSVLGGCAAVGPAW